MKKWISFLFFVALFLSWGTESFSMEESDDDWEEVRVPVRPFPARPHVEEAQALSSLKKRPVPKLPTDIFGVPLSKDLRELNLSRKGVALDETATLILVLSELPEIKRLKLVGNRINACCIQMLNPHLRNICVLDLSQNRLGDHGVTLLEIPPTLTELDLAKNGIGPKGAENLACKLRERLDISILRLDENDLGPAGIRALFAYRLCVRVLSLRSVNLGRDGASVVGERLRTFSCLHTLSLRGNGMTTVKGLQLDRVSLQGLDLGDNSLDPAEVSGLGDNLKPVSSMCELRLDNMALGDRGIKDLCFSESLRVLVLSTNGITVEGIKILSERLRLLSNLCELRLENNCFRDEGVELLYIPGSLQVLGLGRNHIGLSGVCALADSFPRLTSLQKLCLDNNRIGPRSLEVLANALSQLHQLQELSLSQNPITGTDYEKFLEKKFSNLQIIV